MHNVKKMNSFYCASSSHQCQRSPTIVLMVCSLLKIIQMCTPYTTNSLKGHNLFLKNTVTGQPSLKYVQHDSNTFLSDHYRLNSGLSNFSIYKLTVFPKIEQYFNQE